MSQKHLCFPAPERNSRYWVSATAGQRDEQLFEQGVQASWQWVEACQFVCWFSDGERHYANQLWKLASVSLSDREYPKPRYRKVWREGLEVVVKVKLYVYRIPLPLRATSLICR